MEGIRGLLASPVATDSTRKTRKARSTGLWQGHGVYTIPFDRELQARAGDAEVGSSLAVTAVGERYGAYVKRQLAPRYAEPRALGDREVRKLDTDARNLLHDVQKTNRKNVDIWIRQGLVPDIYEDVSDRPWQSLAVHERQHLREGIRNHLGEQKDLLTVATVGNDTAAYMGQHRSLFSCSAPLVSDYLKAQEVGLPVFPGYLRNWAEANYFGTETIKPGSISRMGLALARNVDVYTSRTAKLLYESPLDSTTNTSLAQQKLETRGHAKELIRTLAMVSRHRDQLPAELSSAMMSDLRGQVQASIAHIRRLEVLEANNPASRESWQLFKQNELAAAIEVLMHESQMLARKPSLTNNEARQYNRINGIMDRLDRQYDLVAAGQDGDLPPGLAGASERGRRLGGQPVKDSQAYEKLVVRQLVAAGLSYREASKKLLEARKNRLSRIQWPVVDKQMNVQIDGRNQKVHSRITPAGRFQVHIGEKGNADIFPVHYNGTGRPSLAIAEPVHAVNLGESELSVDENGKPRQLFKGLRSATLSAYGIKKGKARKKANESRAQELVLSALKQQLDANPDLLRSGQPVRLRLSTTSLLTADRARHHTPFSDDELQMQREQLEALKTIQCRLAAGEPLSFTDSRNNVHQVQVNMELAATNFGVNDLALKGMLRHAAGAWGPTGELNRNGLATLMGSLEPGSPVGGWAGEFLQDPKVSAKDKGIVRQLVEQVRDLYVTEEYKSEGEDAYKMVERVIFLAYKVGVVPHYSCKSGKDRTAEADVGVKRLAAVTDALGYVPNPRQPVSQEEKVLSQVMLLESGNIEWQQYNMNRGGYKTTMGKHRVGDVVFAMTHHPQFEDDE